MSNYDGDFFDYVNSGAIKSARQLIPHVKAIRPVTCVLDVGCGEGAWLSIWKELGVESVAGVDGDYVNRDRLLIENHEFTAKNLAQPFDLARRFDIVQSLEVAEHLPETSADAFVASLVNHGEFVVFSAAPQGQGGDNHINEQSYDYWKGKFEAHGYCAIDCLREIIAGDDLVEPWYRYNTIIYVSKSAFAKLPEKYQQAKVPVGIGLRDVSPLAYRIRKQLVRMLPVAISTKIAKLKERVVARARR